MAGRSAPEVLDKDEDVDALLEELEEDDEVTARLREERMLDLQRRAHKLEELERTDHGKYTEVTVEKDFLKITTTVPFVVAHFYHDEFQRCKIVDAHLRVIAGRHFSTKFIRINVKVAPFFVEKLKVQMLPCIIVFVNGISVDRIVGFEELGNTDTFTTGALEKRLSKAGVIATETTAGLRRPGPTGIYSSSNNRTALADDGDNDD